MGLCSRCCYSCLKVLYWTPVVFVVALVVWSYYVYVFVLNLSGEYVKPVPVIVLLLLISHIILFLQLSSYVRTIFTKHKPIPKEYVLSDEQLDTMDEMVDSQPFLSDLAANLPLYQVSRSGGIRYCSHCELIKPDRSHHCSTCGRCILKMDHHCPWVNNCVGYSNYKYFFLFLLYTILVCLWFCLSSLYDVVHIWKSSNFKSGIASKFNVTFCFIIVAVFCFSTSCLFFFHVYLVLLNKTTIENMSSPQTTSGPKRKFYYLGIRRNLRAVFGRNIFLALLPVDTSEGNGASFPLRGSYPDAEYRIHRSSPSNHIHSTETNNLDTSQVTPVVLSGSESEVEIYAVDDKRTEQLPLAQSPH